MSEITKTLELCERQFRMLARFATATSLTANGKRVPKWEAVQQEALAAAEMCRAALASGEG